MSSDRTTRLSWLALALALIWVALARVPLVLNAADHLDSDLAVDGLTLLDATEGHWRWHYPGTPHISALPVLLSFVQAKIWGVGPVSLVSGGVVAYLGLVGATFALNRSTFGPSVATWGLVPLAFASTGTIWLSGRITGGHLLAAAWHAATFALLAGCLKRGKTWRTAVFGLWAGLGLSVDSMTAVTLLGVAAALAVWSFRGAGGPRRDPPDPRRGLAWRDSIRLARPTKTAESGRSPTGARPLVVLAGLVAFGLGVAPRLIGAWADPHDAYREQFEPVTRADVLAGHARILLRDCLPRLIAGHRLPGLQAEPEPSGQAGLARSDRPSNVTPLPLATSALALGLFAASGLALLVDRDEDPARRAVRWGLIVSSAAVVMGFVANRNIFDSDNYRYLVFLLVPWSSGFGLAMGRLSTTRAWPAGLIAAGFAALMTADAARWYGRLGWVDESGRPVRKATVDPALAWLDARPETSAILADYWDAYRLSFLTGGRVKGVPFPEYPDRFPEVGRSLPGGRPRTLIVRPGPVAPAYRARALAEGGREIHRAGGLSVVDWPPPAAGAKP